MNRNRRRSREIAMRLVYEMSISKETYNDVLQNYKENTEDKDSDLDYDYIENVLKGVSSNLEIIDSKIEENLKNWKLYRVSKINLAILRIATYEILFEEDIPQKVSVNEGIELAKKYSEDKSAAFINGILGSMIK